MSTEAPPSVKELVERIATQLPAEDTYAHEALRRLEEIAVRNDASCSVCYEAAKAEGRAEARGS